MVHPYNRFINGVEFTDENEIVDNETILLSPSEEHYMKKLFIKNEIITELNSLSPEYGDISGLRRFGPPFLPTDPKTIINNMDASTIDQIFEISQLSIDAFRQQFSMLRFIFENYIVTFPFIQIHLRQLGNNPRDQMPFWLKIQTLFELFKSKRISNSNDRGTTSKRNLMLFKIRGILLTFFNSSIYARRDSEYFDFDKQKRGAYKKLDKFIDKNESENFTELNIPEDKLRYNELKLSYEELFEYLNDIDNLEYVNGWYINIISVVSQKETKPLFWGSKDSRFYSFIIQVRKQGSQQSWFIKKRFSDFVKFHKELKQMHPGIKVPDLPSKDKHSVDFNPEDREIKNNIEQYEEAEISDLSGVDKESVNELFSNPPTIGIESEKMSPSSSSSKSFFKSPKLFMKSSLGKKDKSTVLSPLINGSNHKRTSSQHSLESFSSRDSSTSDDTFYSMHSTNSETSSHRFLREILRQSLRAFLKFIVNSQVLSESVELERFLETSKIQYADLNHNDIQGRLNLDNMRLVQHYKFQKALVSIVKVLEKDVEQLKAKIYESGFNYVFDRIKEFETLGELCGSSKGNNMNWLYSREETEETNDKSPLRGLVRIIMLEIASTQYELLIGSDSSMATLKTIKKLHYMFPYKIVAGVLRFTNPLMMVKRMIDVFTYQMPTVSSSINGMMQGLGIGGWKKEEKSTKNKSLLQLLFAGILGDDLRKIEKERADVAANLNKLKEGRSIMHYIEKYFQLSDADVIEIKDLADDQNIELFFAILMYFKLNEDLIEKIEREREMFINKENVKENSYYLLSKRYFHLELRKYDKEMMIELWNEPELMNVIKEVISLFLSPLIELFKKADIYKYVPIFAKYMTELLALCEKYNNDYSEYGRSDVVSELVGLEEKYSEYVYKFIRDIYLNDIEDENSNLFEGLIEWLNNVVRFLSFVKKDRPDLKIDMTDVLCSLSDKERDQIMILVKELIDAGEKKKQLMEQMEEKKKFSDKPGELHDWTKVERDRVLDQSWDHVNNRMWNIGTSLIPSDSGDNLMDNTSIVTVESTTAVTTPNHGDNLHLPPSAVASFRAKLRELFAAYAETVATC
ncbi:hypothetical protein CANINC_002318 [Pichia inconspicua]|uniref:PX domain-containing protein n=1 Tax=Pichia inconspicua TaxID=52247 RepID=A0A4T0X1L8_9ASCO|nr:hypothetical protein CANINC_002318 [[Candida] inconspicua]